MPHDVVVGIDGSTEGLAAAHWAAQEAQRRGSGLGVVHVWHRHPRPAPYVPMDSTEGDWAEHLLGEAVRSVRAAHPGLPITGRLVCDATVAGPLTAAADADLLVLGSRGGDTTDALPPGGPGAADGPPLRGTDRVRLRRRPSAWHRPVSGPRFPDRLPARPRSVRAPGVRGPGGPGSRSLAAGSGRGPPGGGPPRARSPGRCLHGTGHARRPAPRRMSRRRGSARLTPRRPVGAEGPGRPGPHGTTRCPVRHSSPRTRTTSIDSDRTVRREDL
nr:universal stress protein [Streptomyces tendae]